MIRFAVLYHYCKAELKNMIEGTDIKQIEIDGEIYDNKKIGLVLLNIVIYYLLFLFGGILILMVNPILVGLDGTQYDNTLWNSLVSSIANLGNIGPAVTYQGYNV
jgi:Trk-type K+ transport system membrane component